MTYHILSYYIIIKAIQQEEGLEMKEEKTDTFVLLLESLELKANSQD